MRVSVAGIFMVFVLSFTLLSIATAFGAPGCSCKGCGCKGGPGWRSPDGYCVSQARLASVCGSPAGAPCIQEAAAQVCAAKPLEPDSAAETEAQ